ncbi:MAG: AAA family ATPase [Candidatus Latescibacteria bacterium]|nr:AAA family ATPase [Candidatus Latescibacterota bacterium]
MILDLKAEALRKTVDPASLGFKTTAEIEPREGIIGQRRAVSALQFGLAIQDGGFNIYVAGPPGIGKMTAVQAFVHEIARSRPRPDDWCYVYNFDDPYRPKTCRLPAGRGIELMQDMQALIEQVRNEVPRAFESEDFVSKRDEIVKQVDKARSEVIEQLNQEVAKSGFAMEGTRFGIILIPVLGGRPLSDEEFRDLPEAARKDLEQKRDALQERLKSTMRRARDLARLAQKSMRDLNERAALYIVGGLIDDLSDKYKDLPDVRSYLQAVQKDIVQHIEAFRDESAGGETAGGVGPLFLTPRSRELPYRKYRVNVVVDNSKQEGAPVVVELSPSFVNLIGRVEKETEFGALYTDFTMIRGGSLHRANGGFLVVPADDLLHDPMAWDGLKRVLRAGEIQIEELADRLGLITAKSLRPNPIPRDLKVILVGRSIYYHILHAYDETFPELFKVKADFDTSMPRNEEGVRELLGFLRTFCGKEKICPLDPPAAAKLIEHASRLAEDQEKVSTHLGILADVVREAHFWARRDQAPMIGVAHVRKAIDERVYRSTLIQEKIQEMIARGALLISTEGAVAGQVNGLSVLSLGEISFGKPSRITASAAAGREGVVDIEREVELGGPVHSKGVLILNGYLAQQYAQDEPLTLAARLVFEQTYEEVEGDSASAAELFALLSALSGLPIRQGIAVTGSVNQRGELQAIGGVNEKIEGFFDVCRAVGLTGEQGVLIPASNAPNLMLREDVVDAVSGGRFHVWTAQTIDEGIELLTGTPAGERLPEGGFREGTVNDRVDRTLGRFAESMRRMAEGEEGLEPART